MHEYSVVSSLIALCEEHAKKNQAHKIERVVVGIGERSAMDKSLFVSAFETFREESLVCKDAVLDIVDEKVELECKDCSHVFKPNALDYGVCEKCHSKNVIITQGNEMRLLSLEMLAK